MHEILQAKIARPVSPHPAKAILAVALASLPATALAQNARSQAPPYCFDLSRIVDLAVTKERFASVAGRPRQGDFRDTSLVLPGWKDCSLYGAATYTCDSAEMDSAAEADKARVATLDQVKSCFGAGWAEAAERSSPNWRASPPLTKSNPVSEQAGPKPPSAPLRTTSFCTIRRARLRSR